MQENERNAKQRYKKKIQELRVELYPTDTDIKDRLAERLAAGEAKATYIKRLIRADIELQEFANHLGYDAISAEVNEKGEIIRLFPIKKDGE